MRIRSFDCFPVIRAGFTHELRAWFNCGFPVPRAPQFVRRAEAVLAVLAVFAFGHLFSSLIDLPISSAECPLPQGYEAVRLPPPKGSYMPRITRYRVPSTCR